ncbi:alkylation response protein AidB-like acyl-CoA dehydrogenase [Bradyrhizobium embrapense]
MSFSEEQVAFRDNVRRMVAKHVTPIAAEIDETDRFPLELVKLFGEMGLMQLWVPERYGGPNGNLTMACIAREEISKVSPACASIAALNTMFIMPLLHFGSEEQRKKYLPIIAEGGVVTAIAISEPQAGSDVAALNTRARKDGDSYVLNGRKQWCSYGVVADYIVVMARTSDGTGADGISAFIVEPKKMPGISFGRHERKMGFRGAPNTPIFFDNVRVPAENLVGEEGKGFRASMRALDLNRPTIGAPNRSALRRARSMHASPTPRSASSSSSRSPSSRACSSCSPTWPCRSRQPARWSMNAPAPAMPATGSASTCSPAWRNASAATWR